MKLRIYPRERQLLGRISLHADESMPQLAKLARQSVHNVRYSIERLEESGIIKRTWIVDVYKLGWIRTQILFSCGAIARDKVIEYFKKVDEVGHLNEIGGVYDIDLLLITRSPNEVINIIRQASTKFPGLFANKLVALQNQIAYFPRKYLANQLHNQEAFVLGLEGTPYSPDILEYQILKIITERPAVTHNDLAKELKTSVPTLLQRIKNLRKLGIIVGCLFSPRYAELGVQNYKVLFNFQNHSPKIRQQIFDFACQHPHITTFRDFLGEWDFEFHLEVEQYQQILEFKSSFYSKFNEQISKLELIPRFKIHHYATFPKHFHN